MKIKKIAIGSLMGLALMGLVVGSAVATSGMPVEDLVHHALCYVGLDGETVHVGHDH